VTALPAEGESLSPRARLGDYKIEDRGYKTPCWIWQKRKDDRGYGSGSFISAGIDTQHAHRAYYIAVHGPIPAGVSEGVLDHLCRVPSCVNPEHLEHVPPHINVHRGDQAKLTMDDAREIRRRIEGGELQTPIAEEYGVSVHTIHWIAEDVMWREDYDAPRQPVRPAGVCCRECGEPITTGKRNKQFCTSEHQQRWNSRRVSRRRRGKDPDGADVRSYVRGASREQRDTNGDPS
jgi:hypothetical protein